MGIGHIRASPAVWQIELPSLIFGKNVKNTPPTVWQKTWQFLTTWEKPASSAQIYVRGAQLASWFLIRWEGEKRNK